MAAVALVLECGAVTRCERRERRKDLRELVPDVLGERRKPPRLEPLHVFVERVHEDPERQVALELRGGTAEDELPTLVRSRSELGEQARLPDPRLSNELDGRGAAALEIREEALERAELRGAPDEMLGNGHRSAADDRAESRPGKACALGGCWSP